METAWTSPGDNNGRQNINVTNNPWDVCDISTPIVTPYDWTTPVSAREAEAEARVVHALLFTGNTKFHGAGVESNSIHRRMPDPHMMCLKLGKRHYCENSAESSTTSTKRSPAPAAVVVPRCQVEGCHVTLGNAKEYYRKHKVCEIHSKAPNVVVLGLQQRFCQQCSRFHGVTEFDDAKRSCRRRLKGHNQRRRKGTHSIKLGPSKPGRAYSLLSSQDTESWNSSGDLSSRCSAALYELIAANRATSVSGHFFNQNNAYHQSVSDDTMRVIPDTQMWDRIDHTTGDMKQAVKEKSKDPEEWTDYCWSSFGGANVV